MKEIVYKNLTGDKIDECRDLCNKLMKHQQDQAIVKKENFDMMNFDTRMKVSYTNAFDSQVIGAYDGDKIVGYIFSTVDVFEERPTEFPSWANVKDNNTVKGFYPDWLEFPCKVGILNNIYIEEEYRQYKIGTKLVEYAFDWFLSFDDIDYIFVFISNGNYKALDYYKKLGFTYTHDVFGDFIYSAYKENI